MNISPISSSWALGDSIILGIGLGGKAIENLQSHPECVINIPDPSLWENVERLAPYTGKNPVPEEKKKIGFSFEKEKFEACGLTPAESSKVKPHRILECPLAIEAEVKAIRIPEYTPHFAIVETQALLIHAHEAIVLGDHHVNPAKWSPIIYNFRHYFGLGQELGKTFRAEK